MDGDDRVHAIVLARKERFRFQALHFGAERVELGAQFGRYILAFARQLQIGFDVGELARQALVRLNGFFEAFSLGENLLRGFLILPEAR